jgi:hypothetical protein
MADEEVARHREEPASEVGAIAQRSRLPREPQPGLLEQIIREIDPSGEAKEEGVDPVPVPVVSEIEPGGIATLEASQSIAVGLLVVAPDVAPHVRSPVGLVVAAPVG